MKVLARKTSRVFGAWFAAAWIAFLCGCQSTPPSDPSMAQNGPDPAPASDLSPPPDLGPVGGPDDLVPGSRITITYAGHANVPQPHEELIREDGTISPPLLGRPVQAAGKKVGELQDDLMKLYVPAYFKTLTITIKYEERYFFVGGQVRNPRQYPYLSQMTVLKAIQAAGDFTEFARRTEVHITRSNGRTEVVDCKKAQRNSRFDLPIYPGDRIWVPQRVI